MEQPNVALKLIHEGKYEEADKLLEQSGFSHRLSNGVYNYHELKETRPCPVAVCYDSALPFELYKRLCHFLREGAPFWTDHKYQEGKTPYFSYAHDLKHPDGTLIEQVAAHAQNLLAKDFPAIRNAGKIEWWAHSRGHESSHQLHVDSDNEGDGYVVRNPIVSVVFFLANGGAGGPTAVTEQSITDPLASHGWCVLPPKPHEANWTQEEGAGRVVAFDGTKLHLVVGGHPAQAPLAGTHDARRTTLMIAFWKDVKIRPSLSGAPGACRPLPFGGNSWVKEIASVAKPPLTSVKPRQVQPLYVEPFYVSCTKNPTSAGTPDYDKIFQF